MKRLFHFGLLLMLAVSSRLAAEGDLATLAIVPESPAANLTADLLTAAFSSREDIRLLERAEVERIYREQGLSAANRNDLRLGRLLGADGLLLLDFVEQEIALPANEGFAARKTRTLNARLVAVNPGVVLAAESFLGVTNVTPEWAAAYVRGLQPLLPKLAVLAKDAVPVSLVNLRSAVSSAGAPELERQLQTLAIQRLSREPQLFVLERQRLQQLHEEKSLSADETAFWSGAWLLEGVADRSGYSRDIITLDMRLTPATGGSPIEFDVSGSRSNFVEVINGLAAKLIAALRIAPAVTEWDAADEAARFYQEAQWAMKWGAFQQAQGAADAAWALGKQDLESALLRVKARVSEIPIVLAPRSAIYKHGRRANFVNINEPPDERLRDVAMRALEYYEAFCRSSPDGEPKVLTRGPGWNDWHSSDWYRAGIETLEAASRVLQHFNYSLASQQTAADNVSELRARTRTVAELIFKAPSVHDSYFVGTRIANHDELAHTIAQSPNIFSCMLNWGCFWQEQPEAALTLYRRLMESPVFCYIHDEFWTRDALKPWLIGWNGQDRERIPRLWQEFIAELNTSTNPLLRLEAKAIELANVSDDVEMGEAFTNFFNTLFENRDALVTNNVELLYLRWGAGELVQRMGGSRWTETKESLRRRFYSEYRPQLEAMNREYWNKTIPAARAAAAFDEQKRFLRENQPYEFKTFVDLFREKSYTRQQALEILPLVLSYKSNLVAKAELAERSQKFHLEHNARSVEMHLQRAVERIAYPEKQPERKVTTSLTFGPTPARPAKPLEVREEFSGSATNIILVNKFLEIPTEGLSEHPITSINITAHHWQAGKLVLDLRFTAAMYSFDSAGKVKSMRYATFPAIAVLDAATERWQVIACAESDSSHWSPFDHADHHTTLWRDNLLTSQSGKVQKYDAARKTWVDLDLPDVGNCQLFTVNDRLYAATRNLIVEILEDHAGMRILASNRRQPPASALDSEDFGFPALFGGPGGSLRVATREKIFSWNGADWSEVCARPPSPLPPMISDECVLFVGNGWNSVPGIWRLPADSKQMDYCLGPERSVARQRVNPGPPSELKPRWKLPQGLTLSRLPAASRGTDLYLLADNSKAENIVHQKERVIIGTKILPQDGYHAALFCFSTNYAAPLKLHLKFDSAGANPPLTGDQTGRGGMPGVAPEGWLCFGDGQLYFGRAISTPFSGAARTGDLPKAGIWVVSLEEIDHEIERQKKLQDEWVAEVAATTAQTAQKLLEQFDRDGNGKVEDDEKEAAFANEKFVASQLDQIDANQNGWLDAGELKFFDANKNETLDNNEQTGIEYAQHLLAVRLIESFDSDGNGLLDRREFDELVRDRLDATGGSMMRHRFPDDNRDSWIDVEEARALCEEYTSRGLRGAQVPGRPFPVQVPPARVPAVDAGQRFKRLVDIFWQNGGTNATSQPLRDQDAPPRARLSAPPR